MASTSKAITGIAIKGATLSNDHVKKIGTILNTAENFESLSITLCDGLSDNVIQELSLSISTSSLNVLQLVHVGLCDQSLKTLSTCIFKAPIRKLDLTFNRIGPEGIKRLAKAVASSEDFSLLLGRNEVGTKGTVFLAKAIIAKPSCLKALDLRMNYVNDEGLFALSQALSGSTLQSLQLDSNCFSEQAVRLFLMSLTGEQSKMKSVSIGKSELRDASVSELLPFSNLQKLALPGNCLSDYGVLSLAQFVIPDSLCLEVIDLRDNPCISDACANILLQAIQAHRSLKRIILSGTRISEEVKHRIDNALAILHSERAMLLTALLSARDIPRLGSKSKIASFPTDLLRLLANML